MSTTRFLSNEALWSAIKASAMKSGHIDAAFAYLGQNGSKLLPLSKGDRLVVNMSMGAVRAGATDPGEIEKLIKRGVSVFTRGNLHAKLLVTDKAVVVCSANVSRNSEQNLDEAGIWTNDATVLSRSRAFVASLCTEPIRPEYLAMCKKEYRPREAPENSGQRATSEHRAKQAKLWVVSLTQTDIPEEELPHYEKGDGRAQKQLTQPEKSTLDKFHWDGRLG